VNVLKVGHHGSGSSSSEEFLSGCSVSPERKYGVIGVGKNNYGHPTEEVLTRLREGGFNIYRTDIDGIVELVSDGREVLPIE
jgi:competence protein ComEC